MTIKAIEARFTSGNDIPVQKAMVPADEWHMAMAEIQVLKDDHIWKLSEISQLQEQNSWLDAKLSEAEKEVERLRKDAARYQWLRDTGWNQAAHPDIWNGEYDAAIDAAMESKT